MSEEKQSLDAAERKRTDMMHVSKTMRNFILLLALCAVASGTGGWLLFQKVIPEHYFGGYCLIPVYFFLFGLFSIGVFDMCRRRAPQKMLLAYLALKALKLISSVMLTVLREMSENGYSKASSNERMLRMMLFVKEHYQEPVRVGDIAASAFISERECLRSFSRSLGISPLQFLLSYRLKEAERLLREEGMNISEIAYRTGFESPSHFSSLFRRRHGITPTEYRKRILSQ